MTFSYFLGVKIKTSRRSDIKLKQACKKLKIIYPDGILECKIEILSNKNFDIWMNQPIFTFVNEKDTYFKQIIF